MLSLLADAKTCHIFDQEPENSNWRDILCNVRDVSKFILQVTKEMSDPCPVLKSVTGGVLVFWENVEVSYP